MVHLTERLSEFSYGYGVTREAERLLESLGNKTAPFLPSLLHEKKLGFDVKFSFNKPGKVLLLQFKLGESLRRYVRKNPSEPKLSLKKPFWRFRVDTAEPDGQYETLLKAEMDGADTYYVAPRFRDWAEYLTIFENEQVLDRSLLITPSEIRDSLRRKGEAPGTHRIVYDDATVHVCSMPDQIHETKKMAMANKARAQSVSDETLESSIEKLFIGLDNRELIREKMEPRKPELLISDEVFGDNENLLPRMQITQLVDRSLVKKNRSERLNAFKKRTESGAHAMAAALGVEVWSLGIQMMLVSGQND